MATVTFTTAGGTVYAHLAGEIDHDSAQNLRLSIDALVSQSMPQQLVLDFSGVGFMDSSGVGLILGRQRRVQALGGSLQIQYPPRQIQKLLQLAHIQTMEV
ncbi:MAG: anti-sigma factor antagonist [Faecalibacterium sp.]|nr:anti-sigma factor antagonist [Faecalibacterium sp.]